MKKNNVIVKLFQKLFKNLNPKNPEDSYLVTLTDEFIKVEHPKRKTEKIEWKDILEIKFINTDSGPAAPDVWLTILGKNSVCLIPQGAKGFETVYDIVSKYEGFNFENVTKSMRSTNNDEFILWKK